LKAKVSEIQKRHDVAVDLLQRLGLDNIKLKAEGDDHYAYFAWTKPQIASNGQVKTSKRGKIRLVP
jgi:hypothetical protein